MKQKELFKCFPFYLGFWGVISYDLFTRRRKKVPLIAQPSMLRQRTKRDGRHIGKIWDKSAINYHELVQDKVHINRMSTFLFKLWNGFPGGQITFKRFQFTFLSTPLKINMEPNNGAGWKILFLLNGVIFRFQPLIFLGELLSQKLLNHRDMPGF